MRGRVRAKTHEGYESLIRRHVLPRVGDVPLSKISPLDFQDLYRDLLWGAYGRSALSGGTVLNLHLLLSQAFTQAVRWQLLPSNPVAGTRPPRPRRSTRIVVDSSLLERALEAVRGTVFELPAAIAAATGMRRGEILALRWQDVEDDHSLLRVLRTLQVTRIGLVFEQPKTPRSRRAIVLPVFIRPYLERPSMDQAQRRSQATRWREYDLVIDRGDGRPMNPKTLSSGWARHLRKHRLPAVRFHDLRHAHATSMLAQGVHPKIVSERLGPASIGITLDTYSDVLPTLQHEAASAFDRVFPACDSSSKMV
jgi:integrase